MKEWAHALAIAIILGVGVGIGYIWQFDFSSRRFLAAITAGIVFVVAMFGLAHVFRRQIGKLFWVACTFAGAVGGAAWWWVAEPPQVRLAVSVVTGALVAGFTAWFENRDANTGEHAA